jgi:hypothetical protein
MATNSPTDFQKKGAKLNRFIDTQKKRLGNPTNMIPGPVFKINPPKPLAKVKMAPRGKVGGMS